MADNTLQKKKKRKLIKKAKLRFHVGDKVRTVNLNIIALLKSNNLKPIGKIFDIEFFDHNPEDYWYVIEFTGKLGEVNQFAAGEDELILCNGIERAIKREKDSQKK